MNLYFVRHGESEANLLNVFSNRGLKHGLTERGRLQVETVARRLRTLSVARLYTSPLLRAVETAQILAGEWGVRYERADALREYDCGVLEGRSDPASWDLYHDILRDWLLNGRPERQFEQGESLLDIQARFAPLIQWLVGHYRNTPDNVVLVGHGGLYRCMLPLMLTNVDVEFALDQPIPEAGVVVVTPGPGGLVCTDWCGTRPARLQVDPARTG